MMIISTCEGKTLSYDVPKLFRENGHDRDSVLAVS